MEDFCGELLVVGWEAARRSAGLQPAEQAQAATYCIRLFEIWYSIDVSTAL
jgi:hypothetical protein